MRAGANHRELGVAIGGMGRGPIVRVGSLRAVSARRVVLPIIADRNPEAATHPCWLLHRNRAQPWCIADS